ncbi:HK97-gp10 family putative phage morphogenesis protein [Deefgea rivuli]|uniref:HK97-gp10 family putative phage morphogenesis protein n=1 Tax=Deefgea rivuli TaxID=400948 RepID=UPI0004866169|nr:HK97-gp10 family putative phage morphogenesis protein [Deefgea rivuli]
MSANLSTDSKQVKQMLADLADVGKRRHVLAALYQGAQVYRKEIDRRVPRGETQFLSKNINAWRVPKRYQIDAEVPEARAGVIRNVFRLNKPRRVALTGRRFKHKSMRGSAAVVNAFYAKYLEGGTKKMSARPFIRPAYQAAQASAFAAIETNINKSITKLTK